MYLAPVARSLAALFATCLALAGTSRASAQEAVVDPPGRVARLSYLQGKVSFAEGDSEEWNEAVLNRPLTSGDQLWVDEDGRVELQAGASTVHLDRQTAFSFIELDDEVMQMSLTEGAATIRVRRLSDRETIQLETPNATINLRHPGEYSFEVDPSGERTVVKTRSGEAQVVGNSRPRRVGAHQRGTFTGTDDLQAQVGPLGARNPFEGWASDRNRRAERSQSQRYVSEDVVGYEDLDDHGEWIHEPEYGHVWRPWLVSYDWAPYRYGHWAFIAPWGWTWIDDARWGFAPFHYGRWAYLRHRWCWVPGPRHLRPVYAPALVGWIGSPSVSISISIGSGIGWFPLAPYEVYVPTYRYTPRYIRQVNITNTVIVNNTYITNVYRGREHPHYRHRDFARAVTAVDRDRFVGRRPIGGERVHVSDRDLREWRDRARPPELARHEVGPARRGEHAARPGRSPKEHGDFRTDRQRVIAGEDKRSERAPPHRGGQQATYARPAQRAQPQDSSPEPRSRNHMYRPPARDAEDLARRELHRPARTERPSQHEAPLQRELREQPRTREWAQPTPQRHAAPPVRDTWREQSADRPPPREMRESARTHERSQPAQQRQIEPAMPRAEPARQAGERAPQAAPRTERSEHGSSDRHSGQRPNPHWQRE